MERELSAAHEADAAVRSCEVRPKGTGHARAECPGLTASRHPWIGTRVARSKALRYGLEVSFSLLLVWAGVPSAARAAAVGSGEEARQILASLEGDPAVRELVSRPVAQARAALSKADEKGLSPKQHALFEATALEWAGVARDLKRARDTEQESDRLEQGLSSIQTELVRMRAAVEQALARVGRARQDLSEHEHPPDKPAHATSAPAPAAKGAAGSPASAANAPKTGSAASAASQPGQGSAAPKSSEEPARAVGGSE
jgi:hypothetical protein